MTLHYIGLITDISLLLLHYYAILFETIEYQFNGAVSSRLKLCKVSKFSISI